MITSVMKLTVNGKERDLPAATNLVALLDELGVDRRVVAIALNGDVVPRARYDSIVLNDGDRLEVVRMVGGG